MADDRNETIKMVTKYEQIEHLIRSKIASGQIKSGERISSEYELAAELGVHRFTVNKAISNLVRAGMLYRIQGKGTFVAMPKEGVASNNIGVVYGGPADSLFKTWFGGAVTQGIYQASKRSVIFFGSPQSSARRGPEVSDEELAKVDGVLAFEIFNDEYIEKLAARKALVIVDYISDRLKNPAVVFDNVAATKKSTKRLIELGHVRIACVGEDPKRGREHTDPAWQDRIKGWKEAMEGAGYSTDGLFAPLPGRGDPGTTAAEEILSWKKPPTAVVITSDTTAARMMKMFQERGIEVPQQMSIVGFGDEEVCQLVTPALTSSGLDMNEMGVKAVRLLERLIDGEKLDGVVEMVETYYVERESIGPPPK